MPSPETPGNTNPAEPSESTAIRENWEKLDDRRLDGNAAAGVLEAIFPFEMTMAVATCAGCGTTGMLGTDMVYMHGMGMIMRCSTCDTVLIRVTHLRSRYFLDLRGVRVLQIAEDAAPK